VNEYGKRQWLAPESVDEFLDRVHTAITVPLVTGEWVGLVTVGAA